MRVFDCLFFDSFRHLTIHFFQCSPYFYILRYLLNTYRISYLKFRVVLAVQGNNPMKDFVKYFFSRLFLIKKNARMRCLFDHQMVQITLNKDKSCIVVRLKFTLNIFMYGTSQLSNDSEYVIVKRSLLSKLNRSSSPRRASLLFARKKVCVSIALSIEVPPALDVNSSPLLIGIVRDTAVSS